METERKNRDANLTRFHACKSFDRNRYRDVLACELSLNAEATQYTSCSDDHSRVRLLTPVGGSDYINANYVTMPLASRKYICTQGPLRNTSAHFWQMVYEQVSAYATFTCRGVHLQNSHTVVMVAKCRENGMPKVFQYFPSKDDDNDIECVTFGKYRVTLLEQTGNEVSDSHKTNSQERYTNRRNTLYAVYAWKYSRVRLRVPRMKMIGRRQSRSLMKKSRRSVV